MADALHRIPLPVKLLPGGHTLDLADRLGQDDLPFTDALSLLGYFQYAQLVDGAKAGLYGYALYSAAQTLLLQNAFESFRLLYGLLTGDLALP